MHVHLGSSIVLRCRSAFSDSVLWHYGALDSKHGYLLYWDGIIAKNPDRFEVLKRRNSSLGMFDLRISNVQASDAGTYRCSELTVHRHQGEVVYKLIVTGQWITHLL